MYRHVICIVALIVTCACRPHADDVEIAVVDLLREADRAEKQPAAEFSVTTHEAGDIVKPSIVVPVPSRLTIPLPIPRRGLLRTSVAIVADDPAARVRFRVGISDHRIYEGLDDVVISGDRRGWVELRTDLSAYAGFKWSLFYRPERVVWRLVLAADVAGVRAAGAVWGAPEIVTDRSAVKEYMARRARLRM